MRATQRSSVTRVASCLAVMTPAAAVFAADPASTPGFFQQPALHRDRLVFVSEGDLWSTELPADAAAPVRAHRLTSSSGAESWPCFSPDGSMVAFAADRDGNVDVHVMPVAGGVPRRLTFHPGADIPLAWTPDAAAILFRSARVDPLGRPSLWRVDVAGGMATEYPFGECTLASVDAAGSTLAFARWSNESWNWRQYRGGTAPDLWLWDVSAGKATRLVKDPANDLFPMFVSMAPGTPGGAERVAFLSDRDGHMNLWSCDRAGGDLRQHTRFVFAAADPTAIGGYDVRWPSLDAAPGGTRIAFAQGGRLAIVDLTDDSVRRLDIGLAGDRPETASRFVDAMPTISEFTLDHTGDRVLIGSRGELVSAPVGDPKVGSRLGSVQLTRSSAVREWGAAIVAPTPASEGDRKDDDAKAGSAKPSPTRDALQQVFFVTDASGEQQLARMSLDGLAEPVVLTTLPPAWLMPPQVSPDGRLVAFGDMDLQLWLLDTTTGEKRLVDTAPGGEIRDYRFSPDGRWLAYVTPLANGYSSVMLHSVETRTNTAVSDGLSSDNEPRWDPAGRFLYVLSRRHFNPILSEVDMEHAFTRMTEVAAYPLAKEGPPPTRAAFHATGLDIEAWTGSDEGKDEDKDEPKRGDDRASSTVPDAAGVVADPSTSATATSAGRKPLTVDADGIAARRYRLAIEAGNYGNLEAIRGGVLFVSTPVRGMAEDVWPAPPLGVADGALRRFMAADAETKTLASELSGFAVSGDAKRLAFLKGEQILVRAADAPPADEESAEKSSSRKNTVAAGDVRIQVDPRAEWAQILDEAWRLQRDFYWDPGLRGVDWSAIRAKYAALLPRVGTRAELNTLVGMMIGELGTSHTYVLGGERAMPGVDPEPVKVGLLGADFARDGAVLRIVRILPDHPWDAKYRSPLAAPWLGVKPGMVVLAVDGRVPGERSTIDELLLGRAGHTVRVTIADDAVGANRRDIEVVALETEQPLRYSAWVEANRRRVDEASAGALGYVHLPDMGSDGLIAFSRLFYPQVDRKGLVVDIRDNGGGFVSQMVIARLSRKVWAFDKPRHGAMQRYPLRALDGHMATIIDQHAGSDGDIFPESFRMLGLGPLIGTRTWGGVVGIRGDKPFVDMGLSTQPEYAWWEPKRGWSLENSGVSPDIEVEITPDDRAARRDPQLEKTIEVLLEKLKADPEESAEAAGSRQVISLAAQLQAPAEYQGGA